LLNEFLGDILAFGIWLIDFIFIYNFIEKMLKDIFEGISPFLLTFLMPVTLLQACRVGPVAK
jgi:hypothetical protein